MATRINTDGGAAALPILLATIPSLPRPILSRLVARMIEQMDELDGDADLEDSETGNHRVDARGHWCVPGPAPDGPWYEDDEAEEDRCLAGDDGVFGGAVSANGIVHHYVTGDDVDREDDGAEERAPHRRRIQRARCNPVYGRYAGRVEVLAYLFRREPIAPTLKAWRKKHPRLRKRR